MCWYLVGKLKDGVQTVYILPLCELTGLMPFIIGGPGVVKNQDGPHDKMCS